MMRLQRAARDPLPGRHLRCGALRGPHGHGGRLRREHTGGTGLRVCRSASGRGSHGTRDDPRAARGVRALRAPGRPVHGRPSVLRAVRLRPPSARQGGVGDRLPPAPGRATGPPPSGDRPVLAVCPFDRRTVPASLEAELPVLLRAWARRGRVVVAVHDAGDGPADPFAGMLPNRSSRREGGRGLWITHQLCPEVALSRGTDGFTVRIAVGRARETPSSS